MLLLLLLLLLLMLLRSVLLLLLLAAAAAAVPWKAVAGDAEKRERRARRERAASINGDGRAVCLRLCLKPRRHGKRQGGRGMRW